MREMRKLREVNMKKLTSILLCLLMLTPLVVHGEAAMDYSEHETFTYWLYATPNNDYYYSYSDNPVTQYLNHKFNVTLEFEQPAAGTETDALSLMFGTGEYTDAIDMSYYTGSIVELYEDGVIVDIAEYLEYMPNLQALLEANDDYRKTCYDDEGRILTLRGISEDDEIRWGGLVYRRDILDTMTGGNIAFPSGNEAPTTIEDWEYMLPLMKAYFEAAGMADYAPLILPYNGYFALGELATGFGVNTSYYLDGDTVKYGPMEEGFYQYLLKMREWYEAGYIYQDFASRTNDLFYLPNTNLTYGGGAGIWYGLSSQIGDVMSMPEYELFYDVHAASSPLDTEHGIEAAFPFSWIPNYDPGTNGVVITSVCENIPKLLSVLDYMYSYEGGMLRQNGLTAEQVADADIEVYRTAGLEDGAYWIENDVFTYNPVLTPGGGTLEPEHFVGVRYPTLSVNGYMNATVREEEQVASEVWSLYKDSESTIAKLPSALSRSAEDDKAFADSNTHLNDYLNTMTPKFIMGTEPLTEDSWHAFVEQLKAYGIEENLRIQQEAYDRYLAR